MIQFDGPHIFQMGWFNHQPAYQLVIAGFWPSTVLLVKTLGILTFQDPNTPLNIQVQKPNLHWRVQSLILRVFCCELFKGDVYAFLTSGQISSRPHTTDFHPKWWFSKGNPLDFQENPGW